MILHISVFDKFIPPFIEFINNEFDENEHFFIIWGKMDSRYGKLNFTNLKNIHSKYQIFDFLSLMFKAKKIILHGLYNESLNKLLVFNPWVFKKCYWVMWGGDFYFPEEQSFFQKLVIKNIRNFITYIKGDYDLVKKWYSANGKFHMCLMYPSNLYKEYPIENKKSEIINLQIGNSATSTNNHLEIFEKLKKYRSKNIKLYAPLSYGDKDYANKIVKIGKDIFGDKFIPITTFMPFEKYLEFLAKIDIAIFNHNRQQAMGNIITHLGLGKKVYLRSDITSWELFKELGIIIFDIKEDLSLTHLDSMSRIKNIQIIKKFFSKKNLKNQLKNIFEEDNL